MHTARERWAAETTVSLLFPTNLISTCAPRRNPPTAEMRSTTSAGAARPSARRSGKNPPGSIFGVKTTERASMISRRRPPREIAISRRSILNTEKEEKRISRPESRVASKRKTSLLTNRYSTKSSSPPRRPPGPGKRNAPSRQPSPRRTIPRKWTGEKSRPRRGINPVDAERPAPKTSNFRFPFSISFLDCFS